jgi:ribosomal protein L10
MLTLLELALSDLWQGVNGALKDVFLGEVAVVVDENLQEVLRVLAELVENVQDQVLVVVNGVAWVENLQEDLL